MWTVLLLIQHYPIYKRKCQLEYLVLHWLEKRNKKITYTHSSLNLKWYRATKLEKFKGYSKFFCASSNSSYFLSWKKARGSIHPCRQDDTWRALVVQGIASKSCSVTSTLSLKCHRLKVNLYRWVFVLVFKGSLPNMLDTNLLEYISLILS